MEGQRGWVVPGDADPAEHEPVLVYFDEDRLTTPAEVCRTCSKAAKGVWVPVGFCELSAAALAARDQLEDFTVIPWGK